jgi:hypothetical protein
MRGWWADEIYRHATPYHAPVYLAQKMGFFEEQGIKVALLEPNDPSGISPSSPAFLLPKYLHRHI